MRKSTILTILLCLLAMALACTVSGPTPYPAELNPPDTFGPENLVGTWQATYGPTRIDTLTIKADGTYQQVFTTSGGEIGDYHWESGWNKWRLEKRPSGCVYIHFEGLRFYESSIEFAEGIASGTVTWLFWDPCEDRVFEMHSEVILRVEEYQQASIILMHMHVDGDDAGKFFEFVGTPTLEP